MNHRGKLAFILMFGIVGAVLSLWLLPPVVNDFGQRLARNMSQPVPSKVDPTIPGPVKPKNDRNMAVTGGSAGQASPDASAETGQLPPVSIPGSSQSPNAPNQPAKSESAADRFPLQSTQAILDESVASTRFAANPFALALFGFIVGMAIGSFVQRQGERLGDKWEKSPTGNKVTLILGTLAGAFAGILVSMPFLISLQGRPEGALLTLGMVLGCSAAMIYLLRSIGPYLPWETASPSRRTGLKVLDTNVLIDGRVYDLIRTGFLDGDLYVPQFVLLELQHIADSSDGLKRQRGRRGLEVLNRIRSEFSLEVGTRDRYAGTERDQVDTRLMKLCKATGADLVSNDFNLNRTATIQEIKVLNINDLALALRPNVLPGETMEVQVIKDGNQVGQGVGYLDDGTMVVVESGQALIGQGPAEVIVTQVIQTERGKMIFADASGDAYPPDPQSRRRVVRGNR